MTMRHAIFIEGAWIDSAGDPYSALVTVEPERVEIKPYIYAEVCDVVCFSFEEFAAIVEMVERVRASKEPRHE